MNHEKEASRQTKAQQANKGSRLDKIDRRNESENQNKVWHDPKLD